MFEGTTRYLIPLFGTYIMYLIMYLILLYLYLFGYLNGFIRNSTNHTYNAERHIYGIVSKCSGCVSIFCVS